MSQTGQGDVCEENEYDGMETSTKGAEAKEGKSTERGSKGKTRF